ncbi:hypothetical protein V6N13_004690 [Hibiscus sabdariffa]|uniref:Uncharacterized protein n=1 Tax=Hibiscus sabdariffa TaxID=183260 RepID=A0ABR2RZA3_9ROSI
MFAPYSSRVKDGSCDELTPFIAVTQKKKKKKKKKKKLRSATNAVSGCAGWQVRGRRRKKCCSISGRMVSNMSLQHWCTRGQLKEKDKIAPIPAYTWTPEPAVSAHEGTPMVAEML